MIAHVDTCECPACTSLKTGAAVIYTGDNVYRLVGVTYNYGAWNVIYTMDACSCRKSMYLEQWNFLANKYKGNKVQV